MSRLLMVREGEMERRAVSRPGAGHSWALVHLLRKLELGEGCGQSWSVPDGSSLYVLCVGL